MMISRLAPEKSAAIKLGLLFLPSIPALIWLWPNVTGTVFYYPIQDLVYIYFLCGALIIGLRRWSWEQLGVSKRGLVISLVCGSVLLIERFLAPMALECPIKIQPLMPLQIINEVLFCDGGGG